MHMPHVTSPLRSNLEVWEWRRSSLAFKSRVCSCPKPAGSSRLRKGPPTLAAPKCLLFVTCLAHIAACYLIYIYINKCHPVIFAALINLIWFSPVRPILKTNIFCGVLNLKHFPFFLCSASWRCFSISSTAIIITWHSYAAWFLVVIPRYSPRQEIVPPPSKTKKSIYVHPRFQ